MLQLTLGYNTLSMKELLVLSSDYPPNGGGIASGWARAGAAVQVIAPAPRKGIAVPRSLTHELRVRHSRPWREWESYRALRKRIGLGPTVCGLWYPDGLLAQIACARPRIILAHGLELLPTEGRWRRKIWRRMLRWVCESADLVIANSEFTKNLVLESAPGANVRAIPLAVDYRHFAPGDASEAKRRFGVANKVVLSTVSRLESYKGHDVVFRAIAASDERIRPNLVYLIAGTGPHRGELERQVKELRLTEQVRFLGFVPEDDLPDLYRASDLSLLCSREVVERQQVEGFGLVFLEAQSCGTPVIGTRTGGIPDAIKEGEGGWLIEQNDTAALSGFLSQLVDDPSAFLAAGRRARNRVERQCTWEQYMRKFVAALDSLGTPEERTR
jgi:phosphatidylinositol alpha-1,6-mannosyltransferase